MNRAWTEFVATVFDLLGGPMVVLLELIGLTALISALWYFYPAWVPRRLPRWRWKYRPRGPKRAAEPVGEDPDPVAEPDEPDPVLAPVPAGLADRLAAEGRYAEAIRERLRATVADLVRAGVIRHEPGQTVTEVAGAASSVAPAVAAPLTSATELFSVVWYAQRPAGAAQDEQMRQLTTAVRQAVPGGPR